jgi:hypothetical protein
MIDDDKIDLSDIPEADENFFRRARLVMPNRFHDMARRLQRAKEELADALVAEHISLPFREAMALERSIDEVIKELGPKDIVDKQTLPRR